MIGSQYGYYDRSDWKKAALIDMIVETYTECYDKSAEIIFMKELDKRDGEMEAFKDGLLTKFLKMCEAELQNNSFSKYIVGETMSIADFCLASFIFNIMKNNKSPFYALLSAKVDKYPHFGAYEKRMRQEFATLLRWRRPLLIF